MVSSSLAGDGVLQRSLAIASVGDEGVDVTVIADAGERAALARIDGLRSLDNLVGRFRVSREGPRGLRATGTVEASVSQTCVVTLEPFGSGIVMPVDVRFVPEDHVRTLAARRSQAEAANGDAANEEDLPDAIVNGTIDLGALTAEFLALAIDPYPRKPDAVFEEPMPRAADRDDSPFAVLGRLVPKDVPIG